MNMKDKKEPKRPRRSVPPEIPIEKWKNLYDMAIEIKDLRPCEYINDTDFFGVKDPDTGEIGYCGITGELGSHIGMNVYRGHDGLGRLIGMINNDFDIMNLGLINPFAIQNCITISFENRNTLENEDRGIIKKLGLKFRGKNQWPWFRSYKPGYEPYFLDSPEVDFLTTIMEQALIIIKRVRNNKKSKFRKGRLDGDFSLLTRYPEKSGDKVEWKEKYITPHPAVKEKIKVEFDELMLRRISKNVAKQVAPWEIISFYGNSVINNPEEDPKPYVPIVSAIVDQNSGMVLYPIITKTIDEMLINKVFDIIKNLNAKPVKLIVFNNDIERLLREPANILGIELVKEDAPDMLFMEIIHSFSSHFG